MTEGLNSPATPTPAEPLAPVATKTPRWHLHRRMYDWMLSYAHTKQATATLFAFSFIEAIFFPVPPFVLQVPMTLARRHRAWWYATVATFGSVAGGMVGYLIGAVFHGPATKLVGPDKLESLHQWTENPWLLIGGVIAIHPYKLFTIAAGLVHVRLEWFLVASLIGRGILFYGIALLLWLFGAPVRTFIDKYFNYLTIAVGVLVIGAIVIFKVV